MRICSLLPSATEIVYRLGLGDSLTGVTSGCDYPAQAKTNQKVVMSSIDPSGLSSREIDDLISKNAFEGKSSYLVDETALKEANPDIILTQGLCEVCAISGDRVREAAEVLGHKPEVISLEPTTISEIIYTITTVAEATGVEKKAKELTDSLNARVEKIRSLFRAERDRPRVFCLEWIDPAYAAGHWIPEMVEIAGGENGISKTGKPSFIVKWSDIVAFAPQIMIIMPCGFEVQRTLNEINTLTSREEWFSLPSTNKGQTYLVDANSYFSKSGPRIVDGLEILAKIIHPEVLKSYDPPSNSILNLRNYMYLESFMG